MIEERLYDWVSTSKSFINDSANGYKVKKWMLKDENNIEKPCGLNRNK